MSVSTLGARPQCVTHVKQSLQESAVCEKTRHKCGVGVFRRTVNRHPGGSGLTCRE